MTPVPPSSLRSIAPLSTVFLFTDNVRSNSWFVCKIVYRCLSPRRIISPSICTAFSCWANHGLRLSSTAAMRRSSSSTFLFMASTRMSSSTFVCFIFVFCVSRTAMVFWSFSESTSLLWCIISSSMRLCFSITSGST
ncbi:ORF40 [Ictalurid herpesvirus 1]|uniref:Uncharacterized protein ORF40 n=1 Tax=Ictalurid herpesvirus 1 (strain Auburn) TaxID=766178 RepID=VG40_ICHVA|nr:ORF40 [Ictalurid herpesvirus 1]Q00145.1 RecName: Full=Uncharacterized protein ORF40 [Ictalurid herpesvirus 1 (strain Auburn)]AAA88143.1 ORF40 [Ictalurid herpesvirus 1]